MSLFQKIPLNRTCQTAGIPENLCVCQNLRTVSTKDVNVVHAVKVAIDHVNNYVRENTNLCRRWTLRAITSAQVTQTTETLLQARYENSLFVDYIVVFEAEPGNGRFESTVRMHAKSARLQVVGDVLRISLHGDTADCVDTHALLKQYCYCKNHKVTSV